jgi:hypothetical protein
VTRPKPSLAPAVSLFQHLTPRGNTILAVPFHPVHSPLRIPYGITQQHQLSENEEEEKTLYEDAADLLSESSIQGRMHLQRIRGFHAQPGRETHVKRHLRRDKGDPLAHIKAIRTQIELEETRS